MATFLANVGVNAAHRARSPLRSDGTFVMLPIPEPVPMAPPMLSYRDLDRSRLSPDHLPESWLDRGMHLDPDLASTIPTYGDNCRTAGRAFSLRSAAPGDVIRFVARLHGEDGTAGFHTVGELTINEILADVTADPGPGWWDSNAHVRRARAHPHPNARWDSFWVFRGDSARSGWYTNARRFGRREAAECFGDWDYPAHRSELQVIASHTRAVRRLPDLAGRR